MLRVFLALATITVLLLCSSAAEANRLPGVLPPPDDPWPEGGNFSVFLCEEDDAWDACGDKEVTPEQRRAVEQRLREMPRLADFHYQDRVEAWMAMIEEAPELRELIQVTDLPDGFHSRLLRWSDAAAFESAAKALPGVSNAYVIPASFWTGKADISITLCNADRGQELCEGRGGATTTERMAIEALLKRTKGVKRIYFADRAHAMWLNKQFAARWSQVTDRDPQDKNDDAEPRPLEQYPETYHVKLNDPRFAKSIVDAVKGLPGVAQAG
ncbi:permease-like cell division protein FtsX [Streptosporangium sp. NPDC023615]|uniref:permease-like cell division protein FtsX n=1 Tax=Streptosporangium sp. NPDC023615 TaxID=3154794 RepID=UPI0034178C09